MIAGDRLTRFSDRVEDYVKYRPGYPPELMEALKRDLGLKSSHVVADLGSGTGIFTKLLVDNGNVVHAVEPNPEMRAAAEHWLGRHRGFDSVAATAEATGLPAASVDYAFSAQAFHWFKIEETRRELARILRGQSMVGLIWNERKTSGTPFLEAYETCLSTYGRDYHQVKQTNLMESGKLSELFRNGYREKTFPYGQSFDLEGLEGRAASSSYLPGRADPEFPAFEQALRGMFEDHQTQGRVEMLYDTRLFYGRL